MEKFVYWWDSEGKGRMERSGRERVNNMGLVLYKIVDE
jgi:hypothetical protein